MSYTFNGAAQYLTGTLGSQYNGETLTIAAWVKMPTWDDYEAVASIGTSNSATQESLMLATGATSNTWRVFSYAGGSNSSAEVSQTVGSTWTPFVAVLSADNNRKIYAGSISNVATDTANRVIDDVVQYLKIGADLANGASFGGLIAEVAFWRSALSTSDITSYLGGTAASAIDATNLIAYFPLSANASKAAGIDSISSLSATGAALTSPADHPTISSGLVKYVKLLASSSAASATGIEGVVLTSTRDTVIGEFSGKAFEANLEGSPGQAVLLIRAGDITPDGNLLTTSDTPLVSAYNTTDGTVGLGSATVIEV